MMRQGGRALRPPADGETCSAPAVSPSIGVSGALAVGESRALPAAGKTPTTVSSGAVSAIVTTTGGSLVSLSTSTTAHDGQVSTCIQIVVDDLFGELLGFPPSPPPLGFWLLV